MMRALLVFALLLLTPSRVRLAPERYESAWLAVQKCSGRLPIPGHELSHLVVLAAPSLSIDGHRVLALWMPGDTLLITTGLPDTGWVIRHELLHFLMQGPTPEHGGPHPLEPFAFPCLAMEFQHVPGGIMGAHFK
jgi:hypothetical protein